MSIGAPKLERREKALEATRRRLRRLEIQTHRIKAELARLEAEYEDDVADRLSRTLRRRSPLRPGDGLDSPPAESLRPLVDTTGSPHVLSFTLSPRSEAVPQPTPTGRPMADKSPRERDQPAPPPPIVTDANGQQPQAHPDHRPRGAAYRKTAPPLVFSLAVHAVALLLCLSFTFATLVQQNVPLFASPADTADDVPEEISEIEITSTKFDDEELQNVVVQDEEFNIADNLLRVTDVAQLGAGTQPLGDVGQLDALPSELGTLMAGTGSPGSGPPGGEVGSAIFFGTRSKGDRFVFVVDNSSSMKGGRLETAVAELVKTVDGLSPRQGFYVIFVSDQAYPMFYPVPAPDLLPATAVNKRRLAEWLPRAILASGKNRELIKAMDMASSLRPHTVFLLWDGDLRYSDKVRLDVMTHLTRPNQWNFTIHTLGMDIQSRDAEYNLTAIAQAHGGTYRRVDVPVLPKR